MDRETQGIVDIFASISEIPRQSKHEEKIAKWLVDWADRHRMAHESDTKGNLVIRVPSSPGNENAPIVILQGHMDMVCEKTPESDHDFANDPIELTYDGEWLTANDTTLGADNGIAIAYALAAAEQTDIKRPPLELLFTVDEETGLTGANALEKDFLAGRILINLDSEDEGIFTIGCAGGSDAIITFSPAKIEIESGAKGMEITIGRLAGGHSGTEIHKHRANANKLLARVLASLVEEASAAIVSLSGGSVRNAIPRDARAVVAVQPDRVSKSLKLVEDLQAVFRSEHGEADPHILVNADPVSLNGAKCYAGDFSETLIRLLRVLPNGAQEYSAEIHGLVETSCNMAVIKEKQGTIEIHSSQRSSVMSQLRDLTATIESAGKLAGAKTTGENSYPPWPPNAKSDLLKRAKAVYKEVFSADPHIEAIHAGSECGVIGAKYPGMDMISFGPTIRNPHSPDERVHIPSIGNIWKLLKALLASFDEDKCV